MNIKSTSEYNYNITYPQLNSVPNNINNNNINNNINNNKKKSNKKSLYLHDISCTLVINLKEISNINNTDTITKKQMEIIRNKISSISNLYKNLRKTQKIKKDINKKILVDKQLLEDLKRRKFESIYILREKKENLMLAIQNKEKAINKLQAKFNEVEIFIHRECQSDKKYRVSYKYFSIDNFLKKNLLLFNTIKTKKEQIKKENDLINIVQKENKEYKNRYIYMINQNKNIINNNINNIREKNLSIDKESNFLIILKDKNEFLENYNKKLDKLYDNFYNDKLIINKLRYKALLDNSFQFNLNEDYSNLFSSESHSTSNIQENEDGKDSSELCSESDIEK